MPGKSTYTPPGQRALASTSYPAAVAFFNQNAGWTTQDWDDTYEYFTGPGWFLPGGPAVANWLRNPPPTFHRTPTPESIKAVHAEYGTQTAGILTVTYTCPASPRFAGAFFGTGRAIRPQAAVDGWSFACHVGLDEPAATGWAATGWLHSRRFKPTTDDGGPTLTRYEMGELITAWTAGFGPTAYLWVLAGYTLGEAGTIQAGGNPPADQQLRVAAALNGHTLPAGI